MADAPFYQRHSRPEAAFIPGFFEYGTGRSYCTPLCAGGFGRGGEDQGCRERGHRTSDCCRRTPDEMSLIFKR